MTAPARPVGSRRRNRLLWLAALAPVAAAFAVGNLATFPNLSWYATLRKPWFNPPDWVFGPAWTVLYGLMGLAFLRVLRLPADRPGRRAAVAAFLVQIALNGAWSCAFFAARNPGAGLAVILALDVAVAVTGWLMLRLDRPAGLCFAPYLAWLAYATLLDGAIKALNR